MNYFVLTRFNLRLWWKRDKNGECVQTESWLTERFRLFEEYTWPSLRRQSDKDFKWICLFDENTPEEYKKRINSYREEWSSFYPFFCNRAETHHFQDYFRKQVLTLADKNDNQLITTYLDNDDVLHQDYVKEVKALCGKLQTNTIISFQYGLQYYEEMNIAVRIPYINNHFLSFYEELGEKVRTVWGFWHFSILKYRNINFMPINDKAVPMWIEVIHKGNVDNDVKMTLRQHVITNPQILYDYGLDKVLPSPLKTWKCFLTSFPIRFAKQVLRRAKNKLKQK